MANLYRHTKWDSTSQSSASDDEAHEILLRKDGSLLIAATVDFDGDETMISLLKTNNIGKFM